jgi:hypothetical protein
MARRSRKAPRRKAAARGKVRSAATGAVPKAAPASALKIRRLGANEAPSPMGGNAPKTIIYIHGIGNKPPASVLKCQWDMALFDTALGDRSRMAYWVNPEYYPAPLDETCAAGDLVDTGDGAATRSIMGLARADGDADRRLEQEIEALTDDPVRGRDCRFDGRDAIAQRSRQGASPARIPAPADRPKSHAPPAARRQ